jgi:hypothetical protein
MDFDGRRLVHAQNPARIEVGLLDTTVLERDLAIERCRQSEDDSALDLRLDRVGVDNDVAVRRAHDTTHPNLVILRHINFDDLCLIATEYKL